MRLLYTINFFLTITLDAPDVLSAQSLVPHCDIICDETNSGTREVPGMYSVIYFRDAIILQVETVNASFSSCDLFHFSGDHGLNKDVWDRFVETGSYVCTKMNDIVPVNELSLQSDKVPFKLASSGNFSNNLNFYCGVKENHVACFASLPHSILTLQSGKMKETGWIELSI